MQHLVIKAIAAAMLVGAGAGTMTDFAGGQKPDVPRDVLNPMVGGQAMLMRASIFENASKSPEHSTLAAAIRAAGLDSLLKQNGPYTIFAPTDAAYAVLHGHVRESLIDPKNSPRPETFPPLEFEVVTVAGVTNVLGQPILIPALDTPSSKIVGGSQDARPARADRRRLPRPLPDGPPHGQADAREDG